MSETMPKSKGSRVGYRPDVKVFDCTIRDGGLINNCGFSDEFVRGVYHACVEAGVDYMEIGYKGDREMYDPTVYGPWRYCDEEDIRRIVGENKTDLKISIMADTGRCQISDFLPKSESVVDMVRVAAYIHQIPAAIELIEGLSALGYETTLNLMALSVVHENELREALAMLVKTSVKVIYIVDSFGSLYSEDIQDYAKIFRSYAEPAGKLLGIHAHNNQQLAYSNTIEAMLRGVSYLDVTIGGLGRGAGNCHNELMLGFLHNPKYKLRPIIECLQNHVLPLKSQLDWGFEIPYMLGGQRNEHPRAAMTFLKDKGPKDYLAFYDAMQKEEA